PGTQNVEPNAYGALLELDHLMTRDDTWSYSFGGRKITVNKKPFDMAFLMNRQNRAGKTFNDKENLSELIGLGMFLAGGPLGKEQADIFDNIVVQLTEGPAGHLHPPTPARRTSNPTLTAPCWNSTT
ncbi:hypothetical protein CTI14_40840, partial [Methylobacterium radiotolerans]